MARHPLISFTLRRTLQQESLSDIGVGAPASAPLRQGRIPNDLADHLRRNKRDLAAWRKVSRNAAKLLQSRTRREVDRLDLYRTGLFKAAWLVKLQDLSGDGLSADIVMRNDAPYASWVHPKGTSKMRTFVKNDLPPIVADVRDELANDQRRLAARMVRNLAGDAVAKSLDRTLGGR
jgi:hypothetical protein